MIIVKVDAVSEGSLADINMTQAQIYKDATAILSSVDIAVNAILARRKVLDCEGQQDTPLVALAGECHSMPAHKLHHMLVLKGLAKSGEKTVFGYENEHNKLSQTFFNETGRSYDSVAMQTLQEQDLDGTLALQSMFVFWKTNNSVHSRNILFRYLQRSNQIPFCLTDAAKPNGYLDLDDPSTANSMGACLKKTSGDICYSSAEVIQVSNHHMAQMMASFSEKHNARIVVQQCGDLRVAGYREEGKLARHSLSAYFKALNIPVLAMPLLNKRFGKNDLPVDYGLNKDEELFLTGVPEKEAIYDPLTGPPDLRKQVDFRTDFAESIYVNALLKTMGYDSECMSLSDYQVQSIYLGLGVSGKLDAWNSELNELNLQ